MTVAFFLTALRDGGAERAAANLINRLIAAGHEVVLITLLAYDDQDYPIDPRVRLITLDMLGQSDGALHALASNLRRVRALRAAVRESGADVLVSFITSSNVLALIATAGLGVPVVGSERIHPPFASTSALWRRLRRVLYRRAHAIVALTETSAAWLSAHTSARRVEVIPNMVSWPPSTFGAPLPPSSVRTDPDRLMLLAVGRLSCQKDYPTLLEAFSRIAAEREAWDLVVVGSGDSTALSALAERLGIGERVFWIGNVGNVVDWYRAADLYVMCSLFEGFPNALAEAMAAGLAVVSSDCPTGPAELIEHEENGLLVPPEDPARLAAALARLMDDEALRKRLGKAARDVVERFDAARIAERWDVLLREAATVVRR